MAPKRKATEQSTSRYPKRTKQAIAVAPMAVDPTRKVTNSPRYLTRSKQALQPIPTQELRDDESTSSDSDEIMDATSTTTNQDIEPQTSDPIESSMPFRFLDLPPEIRNIVYQHTFNDGNVDIAITRTNLEVEGVPQPALDSGHGLLRVCKSVRQESSAIALGSVTNMRVLRHKCRTIPYSFYAYCKPSQAGKLRIDLKYLAKIETVQYDPDAFRTIPFKDMPNLKSIILEHFVFCFRGKMVMGEQTAKRDIYQKLPTTYHGDYQLDLNTWSNIQVSCKVWYLNTRLPSGKGWEMEYDAKARRSVSLTPVFFTKTSNQISRKAVNHGWAGGWNVKRLPADDEAACRSDSSPNYASC